MVERINISTHTPDEEDQRMDAAYKAWHDTLPEWWKHRSRDADRDLYADFATPEQLAEFRAWRAREPNPWQDAPKEEVPHGAFTCDGCGLAPRCGLVFDSWNTDGDCLLEK